LAGKTKETFDFLVATKADIHEAQGEIDEAQACRERMRRMDEEIKRSGDPG